MRKTLKDFRGIKKSEIIFLAKLRRNLIKV